MAYDHRGLAELWNHAECACEEASVLLDTLMLRLDTSHAVFRERTEDLLQNRDLITRSRALLAKTKRQLAQ
jgi:hypothetical protein